MVNLTYSNLIKPNRNIDEIRFRSLYLLILSNLIEVGLKMGQNIKQIKIKVELHILRRF